MAKKITSYDQSGGITAETVNTGGNLEINSQKVISTRETKNRKNIAKKVLSFLVAAATIIAAIIAVLQYFGFGRQP